MPDADALSSVFSGLGLTPKDHVVVYDRSGGGAAGRLFFTLDAAGHEGLSLLDGGLQAWLDSGGGVETGSADPQSSEYPVTLNPERIADRGYIAEHLDDPAIKLLDVRSVPEYTGQTVRAARGGHIPGAAHLEWTRLKDERGRIVPREQALRLLAERGILPDDEVVVYCHTHRRSSHTYTVLRALEFERVRGYPGSWSDWGNRVDTPAEET
jgi:thiosulfate/3-mercaptopyruvate sulfurtransferase